MKVLTLRLAGIRCFEDTGDIALSPTCNLFVGQNNAGKSTLLKGLLSLQLQPFDGADIRPSSRSSFYSVMTSPVPINMAINERPGITDIAPWFCRHFQGEYPQPPSNTAAVMFNGTVFQNQRPNHFIVPYIAKRKALGFNEQINLHTLNLIDGTYSNLNARVDQVATAGHPRHEQFKAALAEIVGLKVTTAPSPNGKAAGVYISDETFVPLDRMGDGVSEMVALIVDLCTQKDKLFVIEEPETNLHPKGLKALMKMVRENWDSNQFIIATHSNIVVRELAYDERTSVFRVARTSIDPSSPSTVEEISRDPVAHSDLLRELGYEFGDIGLHDGWLFLEESSAEQVVTQILVPMFAAELRGRLRTFSAAGVNNLEATISEFSRLITFVHLQPAYQGRFWVRADGDASGQQVVTLIKQRFKTFLDGQCSCFEKQNFEGYYPARFEEKVDLTLAIADRQLRRKAKAKLLNEVLEWSASSPAEAKAEWAQSAAEVIGLLETLRARLIA